MKIRKPWLLLLSLFLLTVFPHLANAHSALVSTVPDGVTTSEVSEITLNFNEPIETATKVKVTNASGEEQKLKEIGAAGKVVTASFEKPLNDGTYTVDWRVISADGHAAKGNYSFEVITAKPTETAQPSTVHPSSQEPVVSASPSAEPQVSAPAGTPASSSSAGGRLDFSKWALVGAAVMLVAAFVLSLLRKRRS